jgi:hypothetical protein
MAHAIECRRRLKLVYILQAVVGSVRQLGKHQHEYPDAYVVTISQNIGLIPLTKGLRDTINQGADTRHFGTVDYDGFIFLTTAIASWLSRISADGPVGYVEVECSGGPCQRSFSIWDRTSLRHLAYDDDEWLASRHYRPIHNPVNQALRYLGASANGSRDEFEALGLGRHRSTEEWAEGVR